MKAILAALSLLLLASVSFAQHEYDYDYDQSLEYGDQYERRDNRRNSRYDDRYDRRSRRGRRAPPIYVGPRYQCMIMTDTAERVYGEMARNRADAVYFAKDNCAYKAVTKVAKKACQAAGNPGSAYVLYCEYLR